MFHSRDLNNKINRLYDHCLRIIYTEKTTGSPLFWMFHSRDLNNKINRLHDHCLRIIYTEKTTDSEQLLEQFFLCQARIQRVKEVIQTDKVLVSPLANVWISKYTSIINCIVLSTLVRWLGVHQCKISWKLHTNTSNTDLQTMMKNIDKFAARKTRPIVANTRNSHSHMLHKIGILKNPTKFKKKHLCRSLVFNQPATFWKGNSVTVVFLLVLRNV